MTTTAETARHITTEELLERLDRVQRQGSEWIARCPAHDDNNPSLSIKKGKEGRTLLVCRSRNCSFAEICKALNIEQRQLMPPRPEKSGKANKRRGTLEKAYQYQDADGKLLFEAVRFRDPKGFAQRRPARAGEQSRDGHVWKLDGVRRVLYRLPELIAAGTADPEKIVFVVEGEKDADNLASFGLVATTCAQGAGKWKREYNESLRGRRVVILPDNDTPGLQHAETVRCNLQGVAREVRILKLEGLPDKGDISDWLKDGGTGEQLLELAEAALGAPEPEPENSADATPTHEDTRPTIMTGPDLFRVVNESAAALCALPEVFDRGGELAEVVLIRQHDGTGWTVDPVVNVLPIPRIRELLTRAACFRRIKGDQELPCLPPADLAPALAARKEWPQARALVSILRVPLLLPDGRILTHDGYDPDSGYYVALGNLRLPSTPERPSLAEVQAAVAVLFDVICDFPFVSHAARAVWLAALLTVIGRSAFVGCSPLFLFDASTRGSGKSKLADAVSIIATGSEAPRQVFPGGRERDKGEGNNELRKRVTALALEGRPLVLLDNIAQDQSLGGEVLDALLTGNVWEDRILGRTGNMRAPWRTVMMASGNNVRVDGDTVRRTIPSRLEPDQEDPESRTDFKYPRLLQHIRLSRGELLAAALTILRGFILAGRPAPSGKAFGSFEEWSDFVRGAVIWATGTDPLDAREGMVTVNDRDDVAELFRALGEVPGIPEGVNCRLILAFAQASLNRSVGQELRAILQQWAPPQREFPTEIGLGKRLVRFVGRVAADVKLTSGLDRTGVRVWRLRPVKEPQQPPQAQHPPHQPSRDPPPDAGDADVAGGCAESFAGMCSEGDFLEV
jgi:hypothetical protein